ncbi:predicted protein [Sclerotinia sclerotiorum 1980 UF-70]|uniref:Uncharacterized protein n=1 Tax=Sclerotinia sclerotiorum (strain ATCC 18683 / 1980 / Ss-1) TaxID=665079 RepID=A7EKP5_SCLS1|nr:predicted protein [Sclerotinia sclerotiorum 1980 UF-70]EDO03411.1 predicted protein [Sclerotinia sclerotiorum 1980 UF-70]
MADFVVIMIVNVPMHMAGLYTFGKRNNAYVRVGKFCDLATRGTRVMQNPVFSYFLGRPKQLQQALLGAQGWGFFPATWQ